MQPEDCFKFCSWCRASTTSHLQLHFVCQLITYSHICVTRVGNVFSVYWSNSHWKASTITFLSPSSKCRPDSWLQSLGWKLLASHFSHILHPTAKHPQYTTDKQCLASALKGAQFRHPSHWTAFRLNIFCGSFSDSCKPQCAWI